MGKQTRWIMEQIIVTLKSKRNKYVWLNENYETFKYIDVSLSLTDRPKDQVGYIRNSRFLSSVRTDILNERVASIMNKMIWLITNKVSY